ncbi:hypothetical protein N7G274_001385 [Stereocaulon virgatum]|uniref:Uncharacterized protein n=1 Tax=Stereocaulon virgatum TaxID=373712 RepID=A0ABR4AP99_9LECA
MKRVSERGQCLLGRRGSMRRCKVMSAEVECYAEEFEEDAVDFEEKAVDDAKEDTEETAPKEKDPLQRLFALQTFEGFWEFNAPLLNIVAVPTKHQMPEGLDLRSWATILAMTHLEKKMGAEKEAWEMCVDKARGWLAGVGVANGKAAQGWWAWAEKLITGSK